MACSPFRGDWGPFCSVVGGGPIARFGGLLVSRGPRSPSARIFFSQSLARFPGAQGPRNSKRVSPFGRRDRVAFGVAVPHLGFWFAIPHGGDCCPPKWAAGFVFPRPKPGPTFVWPWATLCLGEYFHTPRGVGRCGAPPDFFCGEGPLPPVCVGSPQTLWGGVATLHERVWGHLCGFSTIRWGHFCGRAREQSEADDPVFIV